jgi:D-beta-D-heptose 7-phosphate kinase / D-beta-D-heptose 1-phosphate adenosyltransferase
MMTEISALAALLERFRDRRVLVVGDVMLDRYVYGAVDRLSPEAPIPVLKIDRQRLMPGGAGNVALNVAALGGKATVVGLIGNDAAGQQLQQLLTMQAGVATALFVDDSRPTTEKTRFVAGRHQLLRADSEAVGAAGAAAAAALRRAVEDAVARCDVLVLSDYAKGALGDGVLGPAIAAAKRAGKPVIADPKSRDFGRYRGVDVLTPNQAELAAASQMPCADGATAAAAAQASLKANGIGAMLVTRGEQGVTLVDATGEVSHFAAESREVFDVSGAGDSVLAAFALAVAAGARLDEAALLANLAGGIAVGKAGTAPVFRADVAGQLHARAVLDTDAKVVAAESAVERVAAWRGRGLRVGFTNGCFDLIHPGHVALLSQARAACDRLVVGLNTDASVKRLKGPDRPVQNETARAIVLASLGAVDMVVLFDADTPVELIRALRPDVLVKGADYRVDQVVGGDIVQGYGGRVLLADIVPGHSTTTTIGRFGRAGAGS